MSGVYLITCTYTGEHYVGGTTTSFRQRFASHRSALRGGYACPELQRRWDQYGEYWFQFTPLREFPPDQVRRREREAIEELQPAMNVVGMRKGLGPVAKAVRATGMTDSAIRYRRRQGIPLDRPKGIRDTVRGEELTLREISDKYGLTLEMIRSRYAHGTRGEALIRPPGQRRNTR